MVTFSKTFTPPSKIVDLLTTRGLIVYDKTLAEQYLVNIGYYRLSAYLYPYLSSPKTAQRFKPQSSLGGAVSLYRFDKKLRVFLFNEIEKIEIALRSALANIVAEDTGNIFWITDASMYSSADKYNKTQALIDKELRSSKEEFIAHFKSKYSDAYPPAWILIEILPLGVVTRIYENLANNALRKKIAARFGLSVPVFISWLTIVTLTRNSCCHHARVWNKENPILPTSPRKIKRPWISSMVQPNRIFYNICIIKWFIDIISPNNDMKQHLLDLLTKYPNVDIRAMGFPKDWEKEPLWK